MQNSEKIEFDSVTLSNLRELSKRQSTLEEQRICEIYELSRFAAEIFSQMAGDGYGTYEILSYISEGLPREYSSFHSGVLSENTERLLRYAASLERSDRVIFCQLLIDKIREKGFSLTESAFLNSDHKNQKIAYVKNSFSDEAYDVFSQDLSAPRLTYVKTFKDAVKMVNRGECEYCLLPLEEKGGARVSTVVEMIFKDDLKINALTPVFGLDGVADIKYALLSKSCTIPKIYEDDDRYLEILLPVCEGISPTELLTASASYGASIYRVSSTRFDEDGEPREYYSVVFRDEGADFAPLLTYLTLYFGSFIPVGIYKNLE